MIIEKNEQIIDSKITALDIEYKQLKRKMYLIAIVTTLVNIATLSGLYQLYLHYSFTKLFFTWGLCASGVALLCIAALKNRARVYLEQNDRIVKEYEKHWDSTEMKGGKNDE